VGIVSIEVDADDTRSARLLASRGGEAVGRAA
jgi:hypothetical protein